MIEAPVNKRNERTSLWLGLLLQLIWMTQSTAVSLFRNHSSWRVHGTWVVFFLWALCQVGLSVLHLVSPQFEMEAGEHPHRLQFCYLEQVITDVVTHELSLGRA